MPSTTGGAAAGPAAVAQVHMAAPDELPEFAYAGTRAFDAAAVTPAVQEPPGRNKPSGGLWLSPVLRAGNGRITGTAWTEFLNRAGMYRRVSRWGKVISLVALAPGARVAVISSRQDYLALAVAAGTRPPAAAAAPGIPGELDWTGVAAIADAVWLTRSGLFSFGGWHEPFEWWDTETLVVLNPSSIGPAATVARPRRCA